LLAALGADHALNLDGGGSTSLVAGGALANAPRKGDGTPIAGGRRVVTALAFCSFAAADSLTRPANCGPAT
jgi:exopolysaccharide biosynthesis protein